MEPITPFTTAQGNPALPSTLTAWQQLELAKKKAAQAQAALLAKQPPPVVQTPAPAKEPLHFSTMNDFFKVLKRLNLPYEKMNHQQFLRVNLSLYPNLHHSEKKALALLMADETLFRFMTQKYVQQVASKDAVPPPLPSPQRERPHRLFEQNESITPPAPPPPVAAEATEASTLDRAVLAPTLRWVAPMPLPIASPMTHHLMPPRPQAPLSPTAQQEAQRLAVAALMTGRLQEALGEDRRASRLDEKLGLRPFRLKKRPSSLFVEGVIGLLDSFIDAFRTEGVDAGVQEALHFKISVLRNLYARARVLYRHDDITLQDLMRLKGLNDEEVRHLKLLAQESVFRTLASQDPNGTGDLGLHDLEVALSKHVLHTNAGKKNDQTLIIEDE